MASSKLQERDLIDSRMPWLLNGILLAPSQILPYYKWENGQISTVLVYVDDILITGSLLVTIFTVTLDIQATFTLIDLWEINYFLGIKLKKTKKVFIYENASI